MSSLIPLPKDTSSFIAPEDRLGLDGKWDVGIGVWFESVLTCQESDLLPVKYQRQWTVGADYTFAVEAVYMPRRSISGQTTQVSRSPLLRVYGFSALSLNYPLGVVDQVSAMLYRDWKNNDWVSFDDMGAGRYHNWSFYPHWLRRYLDILSS